MFSKKLRSILCLLMVMLTLATLVPVSVIPAHAAKALGTPGNFRASQTTSSITLEWDAVDNATGYQIYYRECGKWKTKVATKNTSITFKNLPDAKPYRFAVRAYYKCKCHPKKTTWAPDFATLYTATQPKVPSKIKAETTTSSIKLTWSRSKAATGYAIYYYRVPSGWKELANTTKTTVTLKKMVAGCKYRFAIRPYIKLADGSIVWGEYKEFTSAAAPKAPKVEASSPEDGKLVINWSRVYGANGYLVYIKYNNGKYKLIKNVSKPQEIVLKNRPAGDYTIAVRAYVKTTLGKSTSPYTPVTVYVDGLLPCGCVPECCHCN